MKYCSNLATISDENEILLAHFSVKEYLISSEDKGPFTKSLLDSEAEISITGVSLAYLSGITPDFDSIYPCDSDCFPSRVKDMYPLAKYCAKYWMDHARVAEQINEDIREKVFNFISRPKEVRHITWLRLHNPDRPRERYFSLGSLDDLKDLEDFLDPRYFGPPLYLASLTGLRCVAERLIAEGADVNEVYQNTAYGHCLQAACRGHQMQVLRLLLDNGAEVDLFGRGDGSTALMKAVLEGHEDATRLLLDYGANPNIRSKYFDHHRNVMLETWPLNITAYSGSVALAELLLERGADIHNDDGCGTALLIATRQGNKEMVRLLLRYGAVAGAGSADCDKAIVAASEGGWNEIVRTLLNHASSDAYTHHSRNKALYCAPAYRKDGQEMIKRLLDHGADINSLVEARRAERAPILPQQNWTTLERHAVQGYESATLFLVEKGATVFRVVYNLMSPELWSRESPESNMERLFWVACQNGWVDLIRLLLQRGDDIRFPRGLYDDCLQISSYKGHENVVELLLRKGSNINAQPGEYGDALQAASLGNHLSIVQRLLQSGADASRVDKHGWSSLSNALGNDNKEVYEELLSGSTTTTALGSNDLSRCLPPSTFVTHGKAQDIRIHSHERVVEAGLYDDL